MKVKHDSISSPTTATQIVDTLREDINFGRIHSGEAFRQEELAERFGVSRIPIREALSKLEGEGLVVIYPNRGAFVSSLTAAEVREIFDLRLLLEADVLRRGFPQFTPRILRTLEGIQRELDMEDEPKRWLELDQLFHDTLYQPSNRPRTLSQIQSLRASINRFYLALFTPSSHRDSWSYEHHTILNALAQNQLEVAINALTDHLEHTAERTVAHILKMANPSMSES